MVDGADMAVQVRPPKASEVAGIIRTVVAEEKNGIADDVFVRIPNADILVSTGYIGVGVVLKALSSIIGEDNIWRNSLLRSRLARA